MFFTFEKLYSVSLMMECGKPQTSVNFRYTNLPPPSLGTLSEGLRAVLPHGLQGQHGTAVRECRESQAQGPGH